MLLHGVREDANENTTELSAQIISENLIPLDVGEIARCHRFGPKHVGRVSKWAEAPRPIIIRFKDENKKLEVYRNKRNLKGKRYVITENLTKIRLELYKRAMERHGQKNVWTSEGRILVKCDGKVNEFRSSAVDG